MKQREKKPMAQADLTQKNLITYKHDGASLGVRRTTKHACKQLSWPKLEQIQIQQQLQIQSEVTIERGKVQVKCKEREGERDSELNNNA